jgi:endonuclease YncB( thermonuclease family)
VPAFLRILAALLVLAAPTAASELTGTVVGVHDGDTITVRSDGGTRRIRLACIDAPELGQSFGSRAKQRLSDLVMRRTVRVDVVDEDDYGRLVGRVFTDEGDANLAMVRAGFAWHYRYHCPRDTALAEAEKAARAERRGLWVENDPVPPYRWRRSR